MTHYYIVATNFQGERLGWTGKQFTPDLTCAKNYAFQGTAQAEAHKLAGEYYAVYRKVQAIASDKMPW